MALVELNVYTRSLKGKNANRRTRAAGRIPAVLYGRGRESTCVEVDDQEFAKALRDRGGRSVIFSLKQETTDEDAIALLREVQRHPVNDTILHIDLFEIPRGKPIVVSIPVRVSGESAAIKRGDATMVWSLDSVEISCLPRELPDGVDVDISDMDINDKVFVKDLKITTGEIITDPEAMILQLRPPTIFIEEEEIAAEAEGEEAAEGAEPADEEKEAPAEGEEEKPAEDKTDKSG